MRYHAMLCRGARLVGYREEECWDDPDPGVAGFKSRANLSEPGHASHLRALGGKKMQLDIVTAVLVTGAGMLLQMSEARARKEALIKPAGGPSLDDNRLRQEEWQRRLEETRERLGKGMGAREGEREFASRVQEAGYTTEPVGTDRIETRTQKRRGSGGAGGKRRREEETEKETEEEEGTHRADTTRSEVWKKSSRWKGRRSEGEDVGGSGIRKDVAAALGGFTEEEYKRQVEELERLREEKEVERSREGGKRRRDDREEEPSMEEEEEANRLRKRGKRNCADGATLRGTWMKQATKRRKRQRKSRWEIQASKNGGRKRRGGGELWTSTRQTLGNIARNGVWRG
jgi:hypothetical protein